MDAQSPPLVILGFDAGVPDFMVRWAQQGRLPALASIMERGCWGRTGGPELICEHGIWVSLLSGVSRGEHGYYHFRQLKPGTYDLHNVTGRDLGVLPFWSHFRNRERKVAIIDVPDGFVLDGLKGVQLLDWAAHDPRAAASAEPARVRQDARRVFGRQMPIAEVLESSFPEDRRLHRKLLSRLERKGRLCRYLLSQDRFDLVAVVFAESHTGGHQFWKYRPEARPGPGTGGTELTHAIREIYQAIDREAGLLLAQLPPEANIFVLSSVGLQDQYPATGLTEDFCRKLGYQASPEPGPVSLTPMSLLRRFVPERWRIALSRNLSRETRERLLADQFRSGTNWRKTVAFSIPSGYTGFLRVNLRGREPEGPVEPGADYEAVLRRLEADLNQLVDPETGEPAVMRITRSGELFGSKPPISLPDLFVEWKPGAHFMRRLVHPRAELVQQKPEFFRNSDHSRNGFFAAAGPSIRERGDIGEVSPLSFAPAFLSLMGEPVPQRMAAAMGGIVHV